MSAPEIIINPKTSRPVKVGSRTWAKLVKDGLIEGTYQDPNELYAVQDGDDVDKKIIEMNRDLPPTQQAVRGRGKYASKIVKRNKQPSIKDTIKYSAKVASRAVNNPEVYEKLQKYDDFEKKIIK